jgi:hypothetical protein
MDKHPKQPTDGLFDRFYPTADNRNTYEHRTLAVGMRNRPQEMINGFLLLAIERIEAAVIAFRGGTSDVGLAQRIKDIEGRLELVEAARAKHAMDRSDALQKARSARWPRKEVA